VDDLAPALERLVADGHWGQTVTIASGVMTPLVDAAELVRTAAGSDSPIETPGGELAAGEDRSYPADAREAPIRFSLRPLTEAVPSYVDWLRRHPAAQGRARA
jgi:hypothetical protein